MIVRTCADCGMSVETALTEGGTITCASCMEREAERVKLNDQLDRMRSTVLTLSHDRGEAIDRMRECEREIMRLPKPPDAYGDGPCERVSWALKLIAGEVEECPPNP